MKLSAKYLSWLIDVVVVIAIWRMRWLDTFDLFMFAFVLATFQIYYLVRDWRLKRYGEEIERRMQSN